MVQAGKQVREAIVKFFEQNPNPNDDQVHDLAESLNISPHDLETDIYSLVTDLIQKRDVIACMLRADRPDLANTIAFGRSR